jgi:muramoyltetrapeptide carboxypeptidase
MKKKKAKLKKSKTQSKTMVGIIAPAGPAPEVELMQGGERLLKEGYSVFLHPQVAKQSVFFSGNDTERALGFLDYAFDPEISILWAARGGYGSIRILPILDEITLQVGMPPHKTLIGFSDNTVLLEYVKRKWGWRVIHGPMPATHHFERVKGKAWKNMVDLVDAKRKSIKVKLKPVFIPKGFKKVQGELVGGNLCTIVSALKTPYELDLQGKILFLEDVGEPPYKLDRMIQQLVLSESLSGVRAIVLGEFTLCQDSVPEVYADSKKKKLKPMRKVLNETEVMNSVFGELGRELGIPIWRGMPVGHGLGVESIELGIPTQIDSQGIIHI